MKFTEDVIAACASAFPDLDVELLASRVEGRLSLPGAMVPNNPQTYLYAVCERSKDEGKYGKRGTGRPQSGKDAPLPFAGFDEHGQILRSAISIDNPPTRFIRRLVSQITDELLTPAQAVHLISKYDAHSRALFDLTTLAQWSTLDCLYLWPCAAASNVVEEHVRSWGGARPWATDPHLWATVICERWRAREGAPGPVEWAAAQADVLDASLAAKLRSIAA